MSLFWTFLLLLPLTGAFRFFGDSLYDHVIPFRFREANMVLFAQYTLLRVLAWRANILFLLVAAGYRFHAWGWLAQHVHS